MQNSFCKSPHIDYNKYSNISPLMPKFQSEKDKKECENSDWVGNFMNRNLVSNQSGRIKLNLELTDIMTPQNQNRQDQIGNFPNNFQNAKTFFNNGSDNLNSEVGKKEEAKYGNFAMPGNPSNSSSYLLNYNQTLKNYSMNGGTNLEKKKLPGSIMEGDTSQIDGETEVKRIPAVQSSILRTSDRRSSFTACLPRIRPEDHKTLPNTAGEFGQALNLTIINNNNYFLHHNNSNNFSTTSNNKLNVSNGIIERPAGFSSLISGKDPIYSEDVTRAELLRRKNKEEKELFFSTFERYNSKKQVYNIGENEKFKYQIKDIIKLNDVKEKKIIDNKDGKDRKNRKVRKSKKTVKSKRKEKQMIVSDNDSQTSSIDNEIINSNNNFDNNVNANYLPSSNYSELTLSNLIKNSASYSNSNSNTFTKAKKKVISPLSKTDVKKGISKVVSKSKKVDNSKRYSNRKGMKYKKRKNSQDEENNSMDEEYDDNKITQIIELNNVTIPILSNEISKLDPGKRNSQSTTMNSKAINVDNLYVRQKEDTKINKIQRTKIPKKKGVRVELVERNEFEEYLINPSNETLDLNASCNYFNPELKNEYLQYLIYGKSNEKNLNFGSDPLAMYKDLTAWYLREKNKLEICTEMENSVVIMENCRKLCDKMNELNKTFNTLPILRIPSDSKYLAVTSVYLNYKKKNNNSMMLNDDKKFECKICHLCFDTGQGLGGHVSRIHQGQSENYNKKKATRLKREEERKRLYMVKKRILEKYGHKNYDELLKQKHGKLIIKRVIEDNYQEYVKMKREMKKEAMLKKL